MNKLTSTNIYKFTEEEVKEFIDDFISKIIKQLKHKEFENFKHLEHYIQGSFYADFVAKFKNPNVSNGRGAEVALELLEYECKTIRGYYNKAEKLIVNKLSKYTGEKA